MKNHFITILALVGAISCGVPQAEAESPSTQVKVTSLKMDRIKAMESPMLEPGGMSLPNKPKKWMFLEASMKVDARDPVLRGTPDYLDQVSVRFYFSAKTPAKEKPAGVLLLTKEIKYINIPVGASETVNMCVFMSPASIKRLTDSESVGNNIFEDVGMEVEYRGKVVATYPPQRGNKPSWWKNPKLIPSSTYPILAKDETPFAIFWYDRYPEIAPKDSGSTSSLFGTTSAPSATSADSEDDK